MQSLSWFMLCLKERLSSLANRQDSVRGAFLEARFARRILIDCPLTLYYDREHVEAEK